MAGATEKINYAENMRLCREHYRLTCEEMAEKLGYAPQTYKRMERGTKPVTEEAKRRFSEFRWPLLNSSEVKQMQLRTVAAKKPLKDVRTIAADVEYPYLKPCEPGDTAFHKGYEAHKRFWKSACKGTTMHIEHHLMVALEQYGKVPEDGKYAAAATANTLAIAVLLEEAALFGDRAVEIMARDWATVGDALRCCALYADYEALQTDSDYDELRDFIEVAISELCCSNVKIYAQLGEYYEALRYVLGLKRVRGNVALACEIGAENMVTHAKRGNVFAQRVLQAADKLFAA